MGTGTGKGGKEWIHFQAEGHIVDQGFRKCHLKTTGSIIPEVLIRDAASPCPYLSPGGRIRLWRRTLRSCTSPTRSRSFSQPFTEDQ